MPPATWRTTSAGTMSFTLAAVLLASALQTSVATFTPPPPYGGAQPPRPVYGGAPPPPTYGRAPPPPSYGGPGVRPPPPAPRPTPISNTPPTARPPSPVSNSPPTSRPPSPINLTPTARPPSPISSPPPSPVRFPLPPSPRPPTPSPSPNPAYHPAAQPPTKPTTSQPSPACNNEYRGSDGYRYVWVNGLQGGYDSIEALCIARGGSLPVYDTTTPNLASNKAVDDLCGCRNVDCWIKKPANHQQQQGMCPVAGSPKGTTKWVLCNRTAYAVCRTDMWSTGYRRRLARA